MILHDPQPGNTMLDWRKANMICRVEIKDNMTIPPMTSTMMPVEIPWVNHLTEYGLIEGTTGTAKSTLTIPGIINTQDQAHFVNVVNYGDDEEFNSYNEDQRQQLSRLLSQYQNVFSRTDDDIGRTDLVTHRINTGNAVPIRQRSRRMPLGKQEMEKLEVNRMLDK
ncbi:unnamed protein product [Mytilus edulis]|uniref:Uncharacterized protein n=1 Tax=Mytilus edulis TaxID=6550 RepID=A0A8S3U8A4_MYTED|nr:unnamed protein product [Mytilus edulis]